MTTDDIFIPECPFCGEQGCIELGRYGYAGLMEEFAAQNVLPERFEDMPAEYRRP